VKISKNNLYKCDSCGIVTSREKTASLSVGYQPVGLVSYKKGNLGVRHLCSECKGDFEKHFESFFKSFNSIINER